MDKMMRSLIFADAIEGQKARDRQKKCISNTHIRMHTRTEMV